MDILSVVAISESMMMLNSKDILDKIIQMAAS